ncbi:MAG: M15 family metallopeptidase [Chitinispirillales bacterium]|jgi:peptidoglycan L-alanyl-D-glutamate endopeptidase CwlK|nr:M15 family metallopeptidase [Chitinispirillales bacterium]
MSASVSNKVNLSLLHPSTRNKVSRLMDLCRDRDDLPLLITAGFRSREEQDALYSLGRTEPGKIVTKAKGSEYASPHQWAIAVDFCSAKDGYNNEAFFMTVAELAESVGFEAGARWVNFRDLPHLQDADFKVADLKKQYGTLEKFLATW